jgi:hypothetical protein
MTCSRVCFAHNQAEIIIVKNALFIAIAFLIAGCSKQSETAPPPAASKSAAPSAADQSPAQDETAKTVARLTQALRKYSAEHQRVPKSLNDLVAEGYISELPPAPPGKTFTFDDKLQVTLADKR